MGSETDDTASRAAAMKAAKKALKKDGSCMKIKELAKFVTEKVDKKMDRNDVRKWIEGCDTFEVEGKMVSLRKKEKSDSGKKRKSTDGEGAADDGKAAKRAAKKAKKEKRKSGGGSGGASAPPSDTAAWRKEHKIVLRDPRPGPEGAEATKRLAASEAYRPLLTFDASDAARGGGDAIAAPLIRQCSEVNGFAKPSPIQAQCWPVLLHPGENGRRRDVVGIAETGSGKTLAFALPALSMMSKSAGGKQRGSGRSPRMLVLAPTRELAMQSQVVLEEFGGAVGLTTLVVYGGVPKHTQRDVLRRGVDCVVATPGRLKDLINEGACRLSEISHLVLDEADRMLDMGFEEDVRFIISECKPREDRQTAMFSATWPAAIQQLALEFMVEPVCVYVGFESIMGSNGEDQVDDALSANKRVAQTVEVIEDRAREQRLRELLKKYSLKKQKEGRDNRILVFALYKMEAERLERNLSRMGFRCSSIHGNKTQDARTSALSDFKDGSCPILVATDVAARGLDIPDVEAVINYTFPLTIEDYIHRIGRTGRAGKNGISHTFFQAGDKSHAGELQQVMRQAGQDVPEALMKFGSTIKKKEHKLYGNFGPAAGPMKKAVKITFDSDGE